MSEDLLQTIWETLESLVQRMDAPQGPEERLIVALQGCLRQLWQYPPERLVAQAERSALPTRPLVSWLAYEADRLGAPGKASALRQYWRDHRQAAEGALIPAPPGMDLI